MRNAFRPLTVTRRIAAISLLLCGICHAQNADVSAQVVVKHADQRMSKMGSANVVVWLSPLQKPIAGPVSSAVPRPYTLTQKDKMFMPHLLVIPTGSSVDFPNLDPFFHNVFSLFNGKRFDLGLYEGHSHRAVRFDREGISYIFCNIHPDMGAVIVSLATPYFAVSTVDGKLLLHDVPPGRYRLHVWAENIDLQALEALSRDVQVSPQVSNLGTLHLQTSTDGTKAHLNKFGESYTPLHKDPY